ncbi:MAG: hypothetical protein AB7U81_05455 [Thiohalomonadaceae bacterium]
MPAAFRLDPVHRERLRLAAAILALDRHADAWLLLLPALWATWLASRGAPNVSALVALMLAYGLARAALWAWYVPGATSPEGIPPQRRRMGLMLFTAALCFAVPLGWPVLMVTLSTALCVAWFALRRHSYLAQPALAAAPALAVAAAWSAQAAAPGKALGLLGLAAFLWVLAALVTRLPDRHGASLAGAFGPHVPLLVAALLGSALLALHMLGNQAGLGVFHRLGLAVAGLLTVGSVLRLARDDGPGAYVLQMWWGAAVFAGLGTHFLCACAVPAV